MNTEIKYKLNNLEYWLLLPFAPLLAYNNETTYTKYVVELLQKIETSTPHSKEYNKLLSDLELAYEDQKMKYQYVERSQIEKAINTMKSSVINRMISQKVVPIANKVVGKVVPVVHDTFTGTVVPAADKTLRFLHKTFAKKKEPSEITTIEQVENNVEKN